jgi:predicted HTH transcriptional regulator
MKEGVTMEMQELKSMIYQGEKVDIECKKAESSVPKSAYESYSAFANTKGGYIILGVKEDKSKTKPEERFVLQGIENPEKQREDFWNTINGSKVNVNILKDENVYVVEEEGISLIVIHVPRAEFNMRPVYVGENPYKGTYKRNHEGDYHATEHEVRGMIRDQNPDGNDSLILEYYTMDDIDKETLRKYRQIFEIRNEGHVWNSLDDKTFLEKLGGYRKDRRTGVEGLTLAGLMMFGTGQAIREEFSNVFMDYRNETEVTVDVRWNDRITYDGTWENNLFNFFSKVTPKLTEDLPKPFKLEGFQRIDETPVHKAVREAFVNLIIHADYLMDAGTLKIIKKNKGFEFTNPGILKLPIEDIFRGGNSKPRNPHMQTMLRMVGFGDNAGSGFPTILATWKKEGWIEPKLVENTSLNQVTLELCMMPVWVLKLQELETQIIEKLNASPEQLQTIQKSLGEAIGNISIPKTEGLEAAIVAFAKSISVMPTVQYESIGNALQEVVKQGKEIADSAKLLSDKLAEKSAEKVSESAEKSAEKFTAELSKRQKQILENMEKGVLYSTEELAVALGLKGPRTRQLLNELVAMGVVECTAATKNRRYIKK